MVRRLKLTAAIVALIALAAGCAKPATEEEKPSLSLEIDSPENSASIKGNVVDLALAISGIKIVAAKDDPGTGGSGHLHIFIDREPVKADEAIPTGLPDVVHTAANPVRLTGLSIGEHRLVVVLGDKNHARIGDTEARVTVKVEGPTVDASAPATAKLTEAIKVEITLDGVQVLAAADDKSNKDGSAGHLHVFVNKDPTAAGAPIPAGDPAIIHTTSTSVEVPANLLKPGENIIWVVVGYADHSPFDPLVLDKVVVTVS